jgi:putative Mn2+ efflux pump MntP
MTALIFSLGSDTFFVSISLGGLKTKGKIKMAIVFACVEAIMPLFGLLVGKTVGNLFGEWTSLIGRTALIAVSVWLIYIKDVDKIEEKLGSNLVGWTLITTALSISLDKLAVGVSIGMIGFPLLLTSILIAFQSFIFTFMGLTFVRKFNPLLGKWSEKAAGVILGLLGLWLLIKTLDA